MHHRHGSLSSTSAADHGTSISPARPAHTASHSTEAPLPLVSLNTSRLVDGMVCLDQKKSQFATRQPPERGTKLLVLEHPPVGDIKSARRQPCHVRQDPPREMDPHTAEGHTSQPRNKTSAWIDCARARNPFAIGHLLIARSTRSEPSKPSSVRVNSRLSSLLALRCLHVVGHSIRVMRRQHGLRQENPAASFASQAPNPRSAPAPCSRESSSGAWSDPTSSHANPHSLHTDNSIVGPPLKVLGRAGMNGTLLLCARHARSPLG